eukprot:3275177-Pleurochrysis_carterae.AAC.1
MPHGVTDSEEPVDYGVISEWFMTLEVKPRGPDNAPRPDGALLDASSLATPTVDGASESLAINAAGQTIEAIDVALKDHVAGGNTPKPIDKPTSSLVDDVPVVGTNSDNTAVEGDNSSTQPPADGDLGAICEGVDNNFSTTENDAEKEAKDRPAAPTDDAVQDAASAHPDELPAAKVTPAVDVDEPVGAGAEVKEVPPPVFEFA